MTSMSVRMSYPLMRAVPDVGGNSPVRIDLHAEQTNPGKLVLANMSIEHRKKPESKSFRNGN